MKVIINGKDFEANAGESLLAACVRAGINIPTLCYSKSIGVIASCRVCVVEVKGFNNLVTSCNTPVSEGMEITTNSKRVLDARKTVLELILADHRLECLKCVRSGSCRLKQVCEDAGVDKGRFERNREYQHLDCPNKYVRRNNDKCILCGRCVRVCKNNSEVGVLAVNGRGFDAYIGCAFDKALETVPCISCGQCVANCPTAALVEVDRLDELKAKINDPNTHVVISTAPSVRVALGDGFGLKKGTDTTGKMVTALKRVGFDRVFDLDLAADFTIMEEGTELLKRIKGSAPLPMLTSCCPGWMNYARMMHPELLPNISTTKSPQQIFGALLKSYYAREAKITPEKIYTVMLMPCVAKESEADREGINSSTKYRDVDMTITVRQAIRLFREYNIDFANLADTDFDDPLGLSSGAGLIFGTTGGVMEAALRTLCEKTLGKKMNNIDFESVRGERGLKVAEVPEIKVGGKPARVAVVSGISNAEKLIQEIKQDPSKYHFIEIMACLGGCVNGGGMPCHDGVIQNNFANAMERAGTLYHMDKYNKLRRSHENPVVQKVYKDYLGEPNSELAHKLLHTHYKAKPKYTGGQPK
ncbi:MAG: [FeFe] hydrogenase, group A [Christensenellaceae bacterium]|jgi:NADP-reducing hydrogenase subunit HndD|nr:[FeFe] hydrogenase, group A [Christensenellaceae bacterium]